MDPIKILFFGLVILTVVELAYLRPKKRRRSRRGGSGQNESLGERISSFLSSGKVVIAVFLIAFVYVVVDGYRDNYRRSLEISDAVQRASADNVSENIARDLTAQAEPDESWTEFVNETEKLRDQMTAEQYCRHLKDQMNKIRGFSQRSAGKQDQMTYLSQNWVRYCEN